MAIDLWGITDKGFYCPTYNEILSDKIKRAKELFGDDIATDSLTPLGKFLRIEAATDKKLYETAEQVYYSFSPATATGVSLDRLGSFVRAKRNVATCAKHLIRVYGTENYVIKAGTLFRNSAGVTFYATSDSVIVNPTDTENKLFYIDITVQCTDAGTVGNIKNINATVTVNNDISLVRYLKQLSSGANAETDAEFRDRYNEIVDGLGSNTEAAIISNVMRINGVQACIIKNNTTDEDIEVSDDLSIAKDTYGVIVYADEALSDEIAKAIFEKQPFGVRQSGVEVVTVKDDADEYHNVKFTLVSEKTANVKINCTVTDEFETDGVTQIRESIKDYINNLKIGKSLIYSKLYEYIHRVSGIEDVTLLIVNDTTKNIDVSDIEIIKSGTIEIATVEV